MSRRPLRTALALCGATGLAAGAAQAQPLSERLQVHGYLTQGFAASDSLPIVGITNRGSVDYRAAALQLRFAATGKDIAVLQLSNRRMGESAFNAMEDPVHVQWAYYQRRLPAGFGAKLGRSPVPRGIFNEVRKVGTVLPFYRAPYNFYTESFETVDGAQLTHSAQLGRWALETSLYGGTMPYVQKSAFSVLQLPTTVRNGTVVPAGAPIPVRDTTIMLDRRADRTVGVQAWLSTPIEGLRLGLGGTSFSLNDFHELSGRDGRLASTIVQGAIDGNFTRFQIRGEWEQQHSGEFLYTAHYQQAGVQVTEKLTFNVQREQANVHVAFRPPMETKLPNGVVTAPAQAPTPGRSAYRLTRDVGIGANYAFRPNVILKLEGHENKGNNYDRRAFNAPVGRYFISSLALSF